MTAATTAGSNISGRPVVGVEEQPGDVLEFADRQTRVDRCCPASAPAVQRLPRVERNEIGRPDWAIKMPVSFIPPKTLPAMPAAEPALAGAERQLVAGVGLEDVRQVVDAAALLEVAALGQVEQTGEVRRACPRSPCRPCSRCNSAWKSKPPRSRWRISAGARCRWTTTQLPT